MSSHFLDGTSQKLGGSKERASGVCSWCALCAGGAQGIRMCTHTNLQMSCLAPAPAPASSQVPSQCAPNWKPLKRQKAGPKNKGNDFSSALWGLFYTVKFGVSGDGAGEEPRGLWCSHPCRISGKDPKDKGKPGRECMPTNGEGTGSV